MRKHKTEDVKPTIGGKKTQLQLHFPCQFTIWLFFFLQKMISDLREQGLNVPEIEEQNTRGAALINESVS